MCGIVGGVLLRQADFDVNEWIERALSVMVWRGPDAEGRWSEGPLSLGARRLRIHDLSSRADQPFWSPDGSQVVLFNGAIFNYRSLRKELEALGHAFQTSSDTEVVLAALTAWGAGAFERFDGMFAVVFYDRHSRKLLVGRDRLGIKPLYVCLTPQFFAFASEIKPLLAHPLVPRRLNRDVLPEFLAFQTVMPPDTLFEGIEVLPPGHYYEMCLDDGEVPRLRCYWRIDRSLIHDTDAPTVEEALIQSIRTCWDADRPVGIQLSGGVDSALITAISHDSLGRRRLDTYSVIFDDSQSQYYLPRSEETYIRQVFTRYDASNQSYVFPPNEIALALPEAIWHHELPLHGASTSLYLLLTRRIHESVTVLITGEGADDIFLGYFADWSFTEDPRSHFKLFVNGGFLKELFGKDAEERAIQKRLAVSSHARLDGMTPCQKASVVTMESVLHGLFARHDRMFMAHSIEGRPPFCANDIVRARFPLVDTQIHSNQQGKIVVKELARRYFERDFVYRKKIGFSAPYGDWCASEDYWRSYVDRLDISFLRELLDSSPLDRVLAMPEGKEKWSGSNLNLIFSLTNFILWHDIFIESRDPTSESAWQSVVPSHFS